MVLLESLELPLGSKAFDFSLRGFNRDEENQKIEETEISLKDLETKKALVLIFMCNHCPYVQAIWPRLVNLQERFQNKNVQFVGINPNLNPDYPEETFEKMKEYYQKYQMNFPYLQDPSQEIAKKYQAQCTPDIYLYDQDRKLVYHGRLDDNWKDPSLVTKEDLAEAIDCVLREEGIDFDQKPAMGCSIKWRN